MSLISLTLTASLLLRSSSHHVAKPSQSAVATLQPHVEPAWWYVPYFNLRPFQRSTYVVRLSNKCVFLSCNRIIESTLPESANAHQPRPPTSSGLHFSVIIFQIIGGCGREFCLWYTGTESLTVIREIQSLIAQLYNCNFKLLRSIILLECWAPHSRDCFLLCCFYGPFWTSIASWQMTNSMRLLRSSEMIAGGLISTTGSLSVAAWIVTQDQELRHTWNRTLVWQLCWISLIWLPLSDCELQSPLSRCYLCMFLF